MAWLRNSSRRMEASSSQAARGHREKYDVLDGAAVAVMAAERDLIGAHVNDTAMRLLGNGAAAVRPRGLWHFNKSPTVRGFI
jgi:hypothetical protein